SNASTATTAAETAPTCFDRPTTPPRRAWPPPAPPPAVLRSPWPPPTWGNGGIGGALESAHQMRGTRLPSAAFALDALTWSTGGVGRRGSPERPTLDRFRSFTRQEWAALKSSTPLQIDEHELAGLISFNDNLTLGEVSDIYLPLTRLLNLHVAAVQDLHNATDHF